MAISSQTKKEFKKVLKEELDADCTQEESDEVLEGLTKFFSLLHQIDQRTSQNAQENSKTDQEKDENNIA